MKKIVVVGRCNIGTVKYVKNLSTDKKEYELLHVATRYNGSGINQSVLSSKLGNSTALISCVGKDNIGKDMIDFLEKHQVDTQAVRIVPYEVSDTREILVEVDQKGIKHPNDSGRCDMYINGALIDRYFDLFTSSDMALIQLNTNEKAVEYAISLSQRKKIKSVLLAYNIENIEHLVSKNYINSVNYVIIDELEAEYLCTLLDVPFESKENLVISSRMIRLLELYPKLIINISQKGILFNDKGRILLSIYYNQNSIDLTGSEDAFASAFATSICTGNTLRFSIDYANKIAAVVSSVEGINCDIPSIKDLNKLYPAKEQYLVTKLKPLNLLDSFLFKVDRSFKNSQKN